MINSTQNYPLVLPEWFSLVENPTKWWCTIFRINIENCFKTQCLVFKRTKWSFVLSQSTSDKLDYSLNKWCVQPINSVFNIKENFSVLQLLFWSFGINKKIIPPKKLIGMILCKTLMRVIDIKPNHVIIVDQRQQCTKNLNVWKVVILNILYSDNFTVIRKLQFLTRFLTRI